MVVGGGGGNSSSSISVLFSFSEITYCYLIRTTDQIG
jgi:hypothetical protein